MTKCQVQSRIICYRGSSAEMIGNPKEQYRTSIRYNMQQQSLVDRREIRIVKGIKDQYMVDRP
jgi:hypothetical protein